MTAKTAAIATLGALLVALVVTTVVRVPWSPPPAPRADQLAALHGLPADAVARGRDFRSELRFGTYASLLLSLGIAVLLGLTPIGARLIELVARPFGGHWLIRAVLGGLVVGFAGEVLTLAVSAWQHRIVVRYGLSTQGWGGWLLDTLKGYAMGAVIGAVVLAAFFWLTRAMPRFWWAPAAAGAAALAVLVSLVYPVLVEPMFNKFTPMEQGPLRDRLVAMADADGVPVRDVLVADASRRTRAVNAYVSGFGPTRRIVVYDTLLREAPQDEAVSVIAHELGHAKADDVVTGTVLGALATAAMVICLYLLGSWSWLVRRSGADSIGEPRAIGLIMAVLVLVATISQPVQSLISRRIEARADLHALDLTGDAATFETMQARLSATNLGDPDPSRLDYLLMASHPSTVERIAIARAWRRR